MSRETDYTGKDDGDWLTREPYDLPPGYFKTTKTGLYFMASYGGFRYPLGPGTLKIELKKKEFKNLKI